VVLLEGGDVSMLDRESMTGVGAGTRGWSGDADVAVGCALGVCAGDCRHAGDGRALPTVSANEESALLATHIREMREFEERMLQSGVSEWLLGTTTDDPPTQIADEVDEYVA